MDLSNLPVTWAAVERLQEEFDRVSTTRTGPVFSARLMDEAQPAGPRTYITAHRYLQIAWDNHLALIALLQHHGATHWAPWNLMRPVFEASFYVVWMLEPDEGRMRRQRGLRAELLDAREQMRWLESLVSAGLDDEALAGLRQQRAKSRQVYQGEATQLGTTLQRLEQSVNLVDEIPKLKTLLASYGTQGTALFVSTWRRLSGFQHGMSYALQSGSKATRSIKIPGGEQVFLTIDDEDFTNTTKLTAAMQVAALQLYIERSTR